MQGRRSVIRWRTSSWAQIKIEGAGEPVDCYLKDINYNGLQICLKPQLPHDIYLKLKLFLTDEFSLDVEAWVAWHKTIDEVHIYGLYFSRIADSDKENIYCFLHKHYPGQIKQRWWDEKTEKNGGGVMKDRRLFERIFAEFPVRLLDRNNGKEYDGTTFDVSAKGVGFIFKEALAPSTPLEMWIRIPDKGEPLYMRGEVAWSRMIEPERYKLGVDLEKADLMGISRCIRAGDRAP